MKKFLLTAALVLALVTSLTAGTMAYYTATVDTIGDNLTTKEFNFTAVKDGGAFNIADIDIAPGDTVTYKVKVTNDSEVATLAKVQATLTCTDGTSGGVTPASIDGLSVTIKKSGVTTALASSTDAAASTYVAVTDLQRMEAKSAEKTAEDVYTITVSWDWNRGTMVNQDDSIHLGVIVTGEQAPDENIDYGL